MRSKKLPQRPEFKEKTQVVHIKDIAVEKRLKNPLISHRLALSLGLTITVMVIGYFIVSAKVENSVASVENAVLQSLGVSSCCHIKQKLPSSSPSAVVTGAGKASQQPEISPVPQNDQATQELNREEFPNDGSHMSLSPASQRVGPPIPESEPESSDRLE